MSDTPDTPDMPDRDGDEPSRPDRPDWHDGPTISISQEMRTSFLDYAMSVIVSRAIPDLRDGLKPVHRRILYSMHETGNNPRQALPQVRAAGGRRDGQVPTRTAIRRSTRRWCGWRRTSRCRCRCWTARAISAPWTATAPPRSATPRCGWTGPRRRCWRTSRQGHRRLPGQLRRQGPRAYGAAGAVPQYAGERGGRHRRRHGHQHSAAQPSAR